MTLRRRDLGVGEYLPLPGREYPPLDEATHSAGCEYRTVRPREGRFFEERDKKRRREREREREKVRRKKLETSAHSFLFNAEVCVAAAAAAGGGD